MKPTHADPHLWAALRLQKVLGQRQRVDRDHFAAAVQTLLRHQQEIARRWERACNAQEMGWTLAAEAERGAVVELVQSTHHYVNDVLNHRRSPRGPCPVTPRQLLEELRQLDEELNEVLIKPRQGIVAVVTKPVTLEGVRLGRFRIELHLGRLADRHDATAFDCVALDPNPAAASEDTTHPHVRDDALCAGEASIPIATALAEGRVCDAFLLISGVLHTYNPGSPYVALQDWSGVACGDCGFTCGEDDLYRCQHCGDDVCESCISSCDACGESYCGNCLRRERADGDGDDGDGDGDYLCPSCRTNCPRCGRVALREDVEGVGMCARCDEEREADEHEPADEPQDQPRKETNHEHDRELDDPVNVVDAGGGAVDAVPEAEAGSPTASASAAP
ncbi:MAG: hypothetical protein WBD40_19580 [Tepidisphaeraceae bacterium]